MKQKIVIEVPLHCGKCKKKILKICTTAKGFMSLTTHRGEEDRVEIIGEGIDAARITERLREKVNKYAKLVRVTMVEEAN
ncbi:hypothetical protein Lalb_Chr04g0247951 [Lupinus albus]|uniref:Heavy metal-associated domain, HMA n=1 Tax=Lupinus albus TaxID=3870 RepID=A0A6A4QNB2_LUPAL|nr:hypothetical protein Lalb_Chr04g0247951 [Lupinus albus]